MLLYAKDMNQIVTPTWLFKNKHKEELIILDASLEKTADGKPSEWAGKTIPESRFFDLKRCFSDTEAPFPNTIPKPEQFEKESQKLGINSSSNIVIYDNMGTYSSPRAWWLFKVMGHANVSVLDGGLPQWISEGYPTSSDHSTSKNPGNFRSMPQSQWVKSYEEIKENINSDVFQVIDARSAGRFNGSKEEPRKHLQSGHIAGSVNIPYQEVLKDGKYKSKEELQRLFQEKSGNRQDLVFSCGSGLTACIIMLAGQIAGQDSLAVYDGSWTEWAELEGLKKG